MNCRVLQRSGCTDRSTARFRPRQKRRNEPSATRQPQSMRLGKTVAARPWPTIPRLPPEGTPSSGPPSSSSDSPEEGSEPLSSSSAGSVCCVRCLRSVRGVASSSLYTVWLQCCVEPQRECRGFLTGTGVSNVVVQRNSKRLGNTLTTARPFPHEAPLEHMSWRAHQGSQRFSSSTPPWSSTRFKSQRAVRCHV